MNRIVFSVITCFLCLAAVAQPPSGKASPGTVYGAVINAENAVAAADLPEILKQKDTVSLKVKTTVIDVCSQKGCWFTFKVNDSTEAFVKMKDYAFFVPMDLANKTVVLDGKSFIKTTSVSELRHYAEDAKKSEKEIQAITKPKKEIRFIANGIVVVK